MAVCCKCLIPESICFNEAQGKLENESRKCQTLKSDLRALYMGGLALIRTLCSYIEQFKHVDTDRHEQRLGLVQSFHNFDYIRFLTKLTNKSRWTPEGWFKHDFSA